VSERDYKALPELLAGIKGGSTYPVYLLYGDEFLYKSAFKSVLDAMVPPHHQDLNYEAIDGARENIYEVVQHLKTFPLIRSAKVIAVHGTKIFYSAVVMDDLLRRSKEAFEAEDVKRCAQYFLYALSMAGMSLDDVREGNWERASDSRLREYFEVEEKKSDGGGWLDRVVAFCADERMTVPVYQDDADVLNDAIVEGYPETNHLILTTDLVDKRRKLFKTIKRVGVVIDCSVPKGERAADKRHQQEALKTRMDKVLKEVGKTIAPGAFEALYQKTGPDMRSFDGELGKVVTYVGDRKTILADDVEITSKRTKQDPIYEMSNAIAERDPHRALFFLDSLLKNNIHPLQVLSSMVNQVRKLILAKDFLGSEFGKSWRKNLSYAGFQKVMLPELGKREPDLLLGNAHPFAVYMTMKQSHNYALDELIVALGFLLDADLRLKRSSQNPKLVLEHAVLNICKASGHKALGQAASLRQND
jgi:DNA polymerase-3 subunit delta